MLADTDASTSLYIPYPMWDAVLRAVCLPRRHLHGQAHAHSNKKTVSEGFIKCSAACSACPGGRYPTRGENAHQQRLVSCLAILLTVCCVFVLLDAMFVLCESHIRAQSRHLHILFAMQFNCLPCEMM